MRGGGCGVNVLKSVIQIENVRVMVNQSHVKITKIKNNANGHNENYLSAQRDKSILKQKIISVPYFVCCKIELLFLLNIPGVFSSVPEPTSRFYAEIKD